MSFAKAPATVELPSPTIVANKTFVVTLRMGNEWRREKGITAENVMHAAQPMHVVVAESPTKERVRMCPKCGSEGRDVATLSLSPRCVFGPISDPDGTERFVFDLCRMSCTSTRVHFRSAISLAFDFGTDLVVVSEPFEVISKPSKKGQCAGKRALQKKRALAKARAAAQLPPADTTPEPPPEKKHEDIFFPPLAPTPAPVIPSFELDVGLPEFPAPSIPASSDTPISNSSTEVEPLWALSFLPRFKAISPAFPQTSANMYVTIWVFTSTATDDTIDQRFKNIQAALKLDPFFVAYECNKIGCPGTCSFPPFLFFSFLVPHALTLPSFDPIQGTSLRLPFSVTQRPRLAFMSNSFNPSSTIRITTSFTPSASALLMSDTTDEH